MAFLARMPASSPMTPGMAFDGTISRATSISPSIAPQLGTDGRSKNAAPDGFTGTILPA